MKRRWAVAASIGLVLLGAVAFAIAWRNSGAHQVSMDDARKRFGTSVTTAPPAPAALRPPAGVYEYSGMGSEHLDKPPKSQAQGPVIPATITHRDNGCWVFRVDYSTGHWQSWTYCPRAGGLDEMGGQTFEQWDFVFVKVDNTSTFTCSAGVTIRPVMRPGESWTKTCSGTSTAVKGVARTSGPFTYVGTESLDIGGTEVAAYHFHQRRVLSGAQTGTQDEELWLAVSNGMPLRNTRQNVVRSDSPIGVVTYTETGSFTLVSLVPQT